MSTTFFPFTVPISLISLFCSSIEYFRHTLSPSTSTNALFFHSFSYTEIETRHTQSSHDASVFKILLAVCDNEDCI